MITFAYFCKGQDNFTAQIDSLNRILNETKADTNRLKALEQLTLLWQSKDLAKSTQYVEEALQLAQKLNLKDWAIGIRYELAYNYILMSNAPKALKILQELIDIVPPNGGAYQTAIAFISLTYKDIGDYENALLYNQQSFVLNERLQKEGKDFNPNGYLGNPVNLAEIFEKLNRLDSALYYAKMAYKRLYIDTIPFGTDIFAWEIPLIYGKLESRFNRDQHAAELYFRGLKAAQKQNYNIGIESAELALAEHYAKFNKTDSAIIYATHAFESAQRTPTLLVVEEAGLLLKKLYEKQNNLAKALYYNDLATVAKDSLVNVEKLYQVQSMTLKEERRQQIVEMEQLATTNRLKQWALVLGLFFISSLTLFLYRNNRQKQKLNEQLALQKTEIETLNSGLEQNVEERTAELLNALNEVKTAFNNGQTTERKRVSADLHDEIGSALSSIAIFSDVTKSKAQKTAPELVPELDRIGVKSRIMIQTMRDTIWSLSEDNQQSVWERMYGFSSETLTAKGITLVWQLPDEEGLPILNFSLKRNLFLAYKEAINNIVKHSEATQVVVDLSLIDNAYQLSIKDNGKGFDPQKVKKDGNGLRNFEVRMKEIGGMATFDSQVEVGTSLVLKFPYDSDTTKG
jgi:signal transduction histidine kinase